MENILGYIIGVIGIITTIYFAMKSHKKEVENQNLIKELANNKKVKYYPIQRGIYNQDFYEYFRKVILCAKNQIYITGKGVNLAHNKNEYDPKKYIDSFSQALKINPDLHVTRIQYGEVADSKWYEALRKLHLSYPKRFHLYLLKNIKGKDLLQIATIDPHRPNNCVSEIMISSMRDIGDKETEIAGSALFVEEDKEFAEMIRCRIRNLLEDCEKINKVEKFDELIRKNATQQQI